MAAHKFIYGSNNASLYAQIVFCEYCGLVAYDANRGDARNGVPREIRKKGEGPCTCAPEAPPEGEQ